LKIHSTITSTKAIRDTSKKAANQLEQSRTYAIIALRINLGADTSSTNSKVVEKQSSRLPT
jgi:gas vesicle protein